MHFWMVPSIDRRRVALPERGVELALVDWGGDGPLCLFSHANGFCADSFGLVAASLVRRYRVIGFDSRGHGDSSKLEAPAAYEWEEFADDLIALTRWLCAELELPSVALGVGHSFGGTCMLTAAARHPELFDRIALLDPVLLPPPASIPWPAGQHPMAERARKRTQVFDSRDTVRAKWAERGTFGDWDSRALELYLQHGFRDRADGRVELKCPGEVEAAVYELGRNFDLMEQVEGLRTPGTLYFAEGGQFPLSNVEKLIERAGCLELESLPGGHLLPMIVPDLVAERLLQG